VACGGVRSMLSINLLFYNAVSILYLRINCVVEVSRSRIHERIILLRFLGIILKILRLEVSVYNVYITNQFQTTFAQGRGE
jgi:hypothetical protein